MSQDELNRINKAIDHAYQGLDKFGEDSPQGKMALREIEYFKAKKARLPPELLRQEKINNAKYHFYHATKEYLKFPDAPFNQHAVSKYTKELQDLDFSEDDIRKLTAEVEAKIIDDLQEIILKKLKREVLTYRTTTHPSTDSLQTINVQAVIDKTSANVPQVIVDLINRAIELKIELSTLQSTIDAELLLSEDKKKEKLNQLTSLVKAHMSTLNFKALIDPLSPAPEDMIKLIEEWESENPTELDRSPEHKILRAKRDLEAYGVSQEDIHIAIRIGQYTASES